MPHDLLISGGLSNHQICSHHGDTEIRVMVPFGTMELDSEIRDCTKNMNWFYKVVDGCGFGCMPLFLM